jgi:hypothetical protein
MVQGREDKGAIFNVVIKATRNVAVYCENGKKRKNN